MSSNRAARETVDEQLVRIMVEKLCDMGLSHVVPFKLVPRDARGRTPDDPLYQEHCPGRFRTPAHRTERRERAAQALRTALWRLEEAEQVEARSPAPVISLAAARARREGRV
jgi:hypothetical protein